MFLLRRLGAIALLTAGLSLALFALLDLMPETRPGADRAGAVPIARAERPFWTRYACWLVGGADCPRSRGGLIRGDLGYSTAFRAPLGPVLADRLWASARLLVPALIAAVLLSVGLGLWMGVRDAQLDGRALDLATMLGLGVPKHWGALVLLLFVQTTLGLAALQTAPLVWPWLVLVGFYVVRWSRYVRSSVREELAAPHVLLARAKGLPERRVLVRHVLRGALVPFVAVVAQSVPVVFSGSVLVESVFSYPGMGLLILESLRASDHRAAVIVFLAYAVVTFFVSMAADAVYRALDPRSV
jgi:peptide/nickel transport system permease protein